MREQELHEFLLENYPEENAKCEWKEFTNLKYQFNGKPKDDVISYVSAIANMEGGHLVLGVEDKTLKIIGIQNFENYTRQNATFRLTENCTNLPTEGLQILEYTTDDTQLTVWVICIMYTEASVSLSCLCSQKSMAADRGFSCRNETVAAGCYFV